jgi:hypothetical protein
MLDLVSLCAAVHVVFSFFLVVCVLSCVRARLVLSVLIAVVYA